MNHTDWKKLHGDAFRGARCLVTGGAGFIGSHVVEALSALGANVVVLDSLIGGERKNVERFKPEFVKGNILDEKTLGRAMRDCRCAFHLAALGSVPHSVEQPLEYHDVDATGTLKVLEAARRAGVRRVMYSASSSAYGDSEELPKRETMAPNACSPYAATKLAGEALGASYANSYGLDFASLRYFNVFGPRQNANSAYAAVIAAFAKALLNGRRPVIYGDGEQSRDFTFVANAVHANLLAARSAQPLRGAVTNVAVGRRVSVNELATSMAKILGRPDLMPVFEPPRAGDVKHSLADLA